MSVPLFRTHKELNSNKPNFAQMCITFKKYSSLMLGKSIDSKARLTGFKSQCSHLLGLGIKFGPRRNMSTLTKVQTTDNTRFVFSLQTGTVLVSFT